MPTCQIPPDDKRAFGRTVGRRLVQRHGKRRFYTIDEIRSVLFDFPVDWHCWAYSLYASADAFDAFHEAAGEVCHYAFMKAQMVAALGEGVSFSPADLDLSWLEWPDLDFSWLTDWFAPS